MIAQARTRLLVKHLNRAIQSRVSLPIELGRRAGISRAEYEELLLQKLFFKNGGIYFKVFQTPLELHQAIDQCLADNILRQDEAGLLTIGSQGRVYLNPLRILAQFSYFCGLAALVAALGFAGGIGINYLLS